MIARTSAAAALGLGLLAAIGAADPPLQVPTASVREALYFGPAGPVRIRLHFSIDGRPADTVWADAIYGLFAFRDRDGNGFLDAIERGPFARSIVQRDAEPPLKLSFDGKNDKVTKELFAEEVKAAGRAPIGLRIVPGRADAKQLSAALFKHIDQNADGRLSQDELKTARDRLAALDVDEDEFFTTAEVLNRAVGANVPRPIFVPGARENVEYEGATADLLFLATDEAQAVKQLLAARGKAGATALRRADIGAEAKTFAALDRDGNGALDATELTAWLRKPPDLELAISFDATGGRLASVPATAHPVEKSGGASIAIPGGRFRFEQPAGAPVKEWAKAADGLAAQFKELAKDGGAVERKQLENQLSALAFFDVADRNADGKVDAAEVAAARRALEPLARCQVDVAFFDLGNGLFELLDRNADLRLSPRELVDAATVLKPFAAANGTIGPQDLMRQFQVRSVVVPIPVGVLIAQQQPEPSRTEAGPSWFAKMDRNGDGDVSLREFVGPIELFRKLDRNGDSLISPAEATAADK